MDIQSVGGNIQWEVATEFSPIRAEGEPIDVTFIQNGDRAGKEFELSRRRRQQGPTEESVEALARSGDIGRICHLCRSGSSS
jgi:hypothetical protein